MRLTAEMTEESKRYIKEGLKSEEQLAVFDMLLKPDSSIVRNCIMLKQVHFPFLLPLNPKRRLWCALRRGVFKQACATIFLDFVCMKNAPIHGEIDSFREKL